MSRIGRDGIFDELSINSSLVLPRAEDATDLLPVKGGIVYDLFEGPESQVWYSNGETWAQITPDGVLGFPVTNPPPPALLPDASILIFNSSALAWTAYSITGDVTMTTGGVTVAPTVNNGVPFGPYTPFSVNQVLGWNGSTWVNIDPPATTPSGVAGGDLTGTYPTPVLAATGVTPGSYGATTQVTGITVNTKGQLTGVSQIPIGGLSPNLFLNTYTESHFNVQPGNLIQILFYALPPGWNIYKLSIAWCDGLGRGGTYDYSGAVRILPGGLIEVPVGWTAGGGPGNPTWGATLHTVFGNTPTAEEVRDPQGGVAIWENFQQDGAVWNAACRLEWVNSGDPFDTLFPWIPPPPVYPP